MQPNSKAGGHRVLFVGLERKQLSTLADGSHEASVDFAKTAKRPVRTPFIRFHDCCHDDLLIDVQRYRTFTVSPTDSSDGNSNVRR